MLKTKEEPNKIESYDCTHCGWAMGEREGEPLCGHCKGRSRPLPLPPGW